MGTKARNGGQQLEVTVIISGDHRKFNIPKFGGASSSDSGEQYLASPVVSSHGGSIRLDISGSSSRDDFERGREEAKGEMQRLPMAKDTFFADARRKGQKGEQTTGGGSEFATDLPPDRPSDSEYPDQKSGVDLVSRSIVFVFLFLIVGKPRERLLAVDAGDWSSRWE